jgi:hypothetical protein
MLTRSFRKTFAVQAIITLHGLAVSQQAQAAVNTYLDPNSFIAAAGPVRTVDFSSAPASSVPDDPRFPGGTRYESYGGLCVSPIFNHFYLFVYTYPTQDLRVDLPPNTYAAGLSMGLFYSGTQPYRVTLSTGQVFYRALGAPDFLGVVSDAPIRWISFSQDETYPVLFRIYLTASAGSVAGCPLPADGAGPVTSNLAVTPNPVQVNAPLTLSATVDDSTTGGSNIQSAEYSISGGSYNPMSGAFNTATSALAQASVSGISAAGVYTICARGRDVIGNFGQPECREIAVYDPSAGFVTGGGWIQSPAGAYTPDSTLAGKATFGFVSRYQSGSSAPTGNTQFHFQAARMRFASTAYEWMVIAGARVQYKGTGTINGEPGYNFLLTAVDGNVQGGGGSDRLRLKIWNSGGIVYDNQMNGPDNSDPTTILGEGSIVIHRD